MLWSHSDRLLSSPPRTRKPAAAVAHLTVLDSEAVMQTVLVFEVAK